MCTYIFIQTVSSRTTKIEKICDDLEYIKNTSRSLAKYQQCHLKTSGGMEEEHTPGTSRDNLHENLNGIY